MNPDQFEIGYMTGLAVAVVVRYSVDLFGWWCERRRRWRR